MKSNMKQRIRCIISSILLITLVAGFATGFSSAGKAKKISEENQAFINGLGTGINLGNALDVCDWNTKFQNRYGVNTQTLWWGAVISEDFIKTLANRGFGVVRVPVTYMNHIDDNGNIDPAWINRVREVVGWIVQNNMYCIIDIHHDTGNDGWIKASADNYDNNSMRVANMISQIATAFNDFDDHLILEGFNEMVNEKNNWTDVPKASLKAHNKWNQLFVDTVRATGGNNATRYILVNTYAASPTKKNMQGFELPKDSANNRLIVGIHNYAGQNNVQETLDRIKKFSDRGFPIIIGEFGTTANATYDRAQHAGSYVKICRDYGFCPIWWDNGENPNNHKNSSFAIYERKSCAEYYPELINALISR